MDRRTHGANQSSLNPRRVPARSQRQDGELLKGSRKIAQGWQRSSERPTITPAGAPEHVRTRGLDAISGPNDFRNYWRKSCRHQSRGTIITSFVEPSANRFLRSQSSVSCRRKAWLGGDLLNSWGQLLQHGALRRHPRTPGRSPIWRADRRRGQTQMAPWLAFGQGAQDLQCTECRKQRDQVRITFWTETAVNSWA
ncbi:hypothetical protein K437DRAFT_137687 [Tilletiaria anomala UBC 951]|uniref:Uncharacterized protein n=1 Tax=Tilletiaria anomala (strain ATCC 24038 / CBS 436.72 / UBC 951) TaxID=1037660 RepID=A0A066W0B9_TILAU|nr:uncharacterized protein K437DRAFT_137687 [Tilletiaria anomala UBC 951]KDN44509.1 hypothetical protein K437DRAFT_137687 [Tilletiaria anomala UBC 951]